MKRQKGITLIALIITIIVLLILAGVTIGAITGESGILKNTEISVDKYKREKGMEQIQLVLGDDSIKRSITKEPLNTERLLNLFSPKEREWVESVNEITDKDGIIIVNDEGYMYEIVINEKGKVEVEYIGKNTGPIIKDIEVINKDTNSIQIELKTINAEEGKYIYWYKKEGETDYKKAGDSESNTYTYTNLEANEIYNIKVELETNKGKTEKVINVLTGEMPEGIITFGDPIWNNGTASVTVSTNKTGYILQYQKNGTIDTEWITIENEGSVTGLTHNDKVYARLWDGTNGGDYAHVDIQDTTTPTAKVEVTGTPIVGTNEWYRSDITVQITGITTGSKITKVTYALNGGTEIEIQNGETITISTEGTTIITAYAYNTAGTKSEAGTLTVKKDATVATINADLSSSDITESGFTLNVGIQDSTSGINKIVWHYKLSTVETYTTETEEFTATTSAITKTKSITGLSAGTYDVYAVIYDEAGNTKQTNTITPTIQEIVEVSIWNIPDGNMEEITCYWSDSFIKGPTWEEYISIATPQANFDDMFWLEIIDGYVYCMYYYQSRSFLVQDVNGDSILASELVKSGEYYFTALYGECVFPDSAILVSKDNETILAKDIKEGDNIVYLNIDSQELEIGKVNKVYIHKKATNFVRYIFEDGTYLEVTDYHPIYTKQGWKSYTRRNGYDIPQIADEVKTPTGWKKLTKIETWIGEEDCYDFAIINEKGEIINNYFANGTLVQGSY